MIDVGAATTALFEAARDVRERAYAPYSKFQVGAALRAVDGRIFAAANVENAAYPQGQCAEASAIGAMIAAGAQRIAEICVVAGGERLIAPCGGCRQRLAEFAAAATPVHLGSPDGIRESTTVGALLPLSFGAGHLDERGPSASAADRLRQLAIVPDCRIAVILGSGLGALVDALEAPETVPYAELEGFPEPSVEGHAGVLVGGRLAGVPLLCLKGRVHLYEGVAASAVNAPIRALKALGIRLLILTNAAGAIAERFEPGAIALIGDHINALGTSPLIGPNADEIGPRFPDLSMVYDADLRGLTHAAAASLGMRLEEGVYLATLGPAFETPAEIRAFRALGADLVGMSTVPEAISARHAGLKVLGFSAVTNRAAGLAPGSVSHEETLRMGSLAGGKLIDLLRSALVELHDVL